MPAKNEEAQKRLEEIMEKLEQGVKDVFTSEKYVKYLSTMAKFHDYSFNNILLIAMQRPDATRIAGYQAWKKNFGRNVMKGEKGIRILAPSPYKIKQSVEKKDPETGKSLIGKDGKPIMEEKEITIPAYKVVTVFDVSQTEGKELPTIADELTGDVEQYEDFFAALEKSSPVPIDFEKIKGGAHGYYRLDEKRIAIDEGMSELQSLKTTIHEIAHAKMHDNDNSASKEQQESINRRTKEVQAESVAYIVCQHYGLDTSDYSFEYIAIWSSGRETEELKESLTVIRDTASELIKGIDKNLAELTKDKEQAREGRREYGEMEADDSGHEGGYEIMDFFEEIRKEREAQATEAEAKEQQPKSIFRVTMYGEQFFCENTSGLDADALCKAYADCDKPFVEMTRYGKQISEADYAYIQQGENVLFSVDFNADRDEITISEGERFETKGLKETVARVKAGSRQSVLENLHNKQNEIKRNQSGEQRTIEKLDRRMER